MVTAGLCNSLTFVAERPTAQVNTAIIEHEPADVAVTIVPLTLPYDIWTDKVVYTWVAVCSRTASVRHVSGSAPAVGLFLAFHYMATCGPHRIGPPDCVACLNTRATAAQITAMKLLCHIPDDIELARDTVAAKLEAHGCSHNKAA